jgi:hypothetical protein
MRRLPRSGLYWLAGAALVAALVAGCTQPQKTGTAKAPTAQTARKAPAQQPGAPATAKPINKAQPGPAGPAQQLRPVGNKKMTAANPSAGPAELRPTGHAAAPSAGTADAAKKEGCGAAEAKAPGQAPEPGPLAVNAPNAHTPGANTVDLTPPPPDQPQPKLVCKQTKMVGDPVWQGKNAVFTFTISNEGEGPLAIHIKPT